MWIIAKNKEERMIIYNKLKELNFSGNSCCYMISNINYVYIDSIEKIFNFGCRYPSMIKKEDIISYEEFLSWFKILNYCEIPNYKIDEMTVVEKQSAARMIVSLRESESWFESALAVINKADKNSGCLYAVEELLRRPDLSLNVMVMLSDDWDYLD